MMLLTGKSEFRQRSCGGVSDTASEAFTLIEALVTVVILAVGITLVLRAFETSLYALSESRHSLRATMLIGEKMSDARLAALAEGATSLGSASGRDADYEWEMEQADHTPAKDAAGSNRLNKVTVTVQRKGADRKYFATTYIITQPSS